MDKDKWQGLDTFWNSFGIPAYDENSVPEDAELPYITYEASIGSFEDVVPLTASVWYYGTSWVDVSNKVDEISRRLNGWYIQRLSDTQYIYFKKNQAGLFAQRVADPNVLIKRIRLSISAEFLTHD